MASQRGKYSAPFARGDRVTTTHRVYPFLADEILTVTSVENIGRKSRPSWLVGLASSRGGQGSADAGEIVLALAALADRARAGSQAAFLGSLTHAEVAELTSTSGSPRAFWESVHAGGGSGSGDDRGPRELERDVLGVVRAGVRW